ncbi:hypothetical protein C8Q72DRAFT_791116 [Fomitopsis betulina]|nr:hypothetical protein C8Q72DRAFT_791116 [Fomitopsis betulina]
MQPRLRPVLPAVRATNDHNESSLGALRVRKRRAPNKSKLKYNAETMFSANKTAAFVRNHLSGTTANMRYIRRLGRKLDRAGLGKKKRNMLMLAKRARVRRHCEKRDLRVAAREKKDAVIDGATPILNANYWRTVDRRTIIVDKHIKPQLYWHQRANPGAKVKVTVPDDMMDTDSEYEEEELFQS